jgi:hypothetical protein
LSRVISAINRVPQSRCTDSTAAALCCPAGSSGLASLTLRLMRCAPKLWLHASPTNQHTDSN